MDVPEMMLKVGPGRGNAVGGPTWNGHAASTLTPGPVMSGFRIPGFWRLGPREEKEMVDGAGDVPRIVPWKRICAVAFAVELR
jgi:hypothetical protein